MAYGQAYRQPADSAGLKSVKPRYRGLEAVQPEFTGLQNRPRVCIPYLQQISDVRILIRYHGKPHFYGGLIYLLITAKIFRWLCG